MVVQCKQLTFSKLRESYLTVAAFVEQESFLPVTSLYTKIGCDLGMDGDDASDLITKFVSRYGLSYDGFEFSRHFYSEGELYDSTAALLNIFIFLINALITVIELLSFKLIRIEDRPTWFTPNRAVTDLTFKQLLTWYIEKDFKEADSISYKLLMAS